MKTNLFTVLIIGSTIASCNPARDEMKQTFQSPPNSLRPQPFWHMNGEMTTQGLKEQIDAASGKDGFGGVAVLPVSPAKSWTGDEMTDGTLPPYLSDSYFDRYKDILDLSASKNMEVILYDDIDFPTGSIGGKISRDYPQYTQKRLDKAEVTCKGPSLWKGSVTREGVLMGVVAMNTSTLERIDLTDLVKDHALQWEVPAGEWRLMTFTLTDKADYKIDYMNPEAVKLFISLTYDEYAKRFSSYFGKTITKTFFDDVGYLSNNRLWNEELTSRFEREYAKNARLYYPALWEDIGPETSATRVAFFGLRAQMMGDGFTRLAAEWCDRHGLVSMGHPPGNYEPTTVDMYGDPFKYYRYTHVPLMDAIHGYPYGRPGFKLISSAADAHNRPMVAAEINGNYPASMDSAMLYRVAMEVMVRGINFLIPHGMWYNPSQVKIPPLIAHYNPLLAPALAEYSTCMGRSVSLLQRGARKCDIALLFPIEDLEAWWGFEIPGRPSIGKDVPPSSNYNLIGDMLTAQVRRDFTFLHPEEFLDAAKYTLQEGQIRLNTTLTPQTYRVLIVPSMRVARVETLKKALQFAQQGGKVLIVGELPSMSAEYGRENELKELLAGLHPSAPSEVSFPGNGTLLYQPHLSKASLEQALDRLLPVPDVKIAPVVTLKHQDQPDFVGLGAKHERGLSSPQLGQFAYLHKSTPEGEVYYFANSTDSPVETTVLIRGSHRLEQWNPHTGEIGKWESKTVEVEGEPCTEIKLSLPPVKSVFAVSK